MDVAVLLEALFRWIHIVAGIVWIGHLYFFNFVNGPFEGTLDAAGKKTVVPQLRPRALYWFRWGAAWTWVTGVLLVLLVFYHGGIMFDMGGPWNAAAVVLVLFTFLAFPLYDALAKSTLGKNNQNMAYASLVLVYVLLVLFHRVGNFSYRATVIHLGAFFGTLMAANVWMRIWPAQQKIITAIRDGQAPDAALVGMAGTRSRHNTYMSVPLVWAMINSHTTVPFATEGILGIEAWIVILVAIAWWIVMQLYAKAAAVKGF